MQECSELEQLQLAGRQWNLWFCGSWTEAGMAAFRTARPDVCVVTSN